jgi:hypothetical protein
MDSKKYSPKDGHNFLRDLAKRLGQQTGHLGFDRRLARILRMEWKTIASRVGAAVLGAGQRWPTPPVGQHFRHFFH